MKNLRKYIVIISIMLFFSCDSEPIDNPPVSCFNITQDDTVEHALESKWIFLGYLSGSEYCKPSDIPEMNIVFSDSGTFLGQSSCNYYEGDFSVFSNDSMLIKNFFTTMMYCVDDSVMWWEDKYYSGLENVVKYNIEGAKLTLETGNNEEFIFEVE